MSIKISSKIANSPYYVGKSSAKSVKTIQRLMSEVVDFFKEYGYKPQKNLLERKPSTDEFCYTYDGFNKKHYYQKGNTIKQVLMSYKSGHTFQQDDYDSSGKVIRSIISEPRRNKKALIIHKYQKGKPVKDIYYDSNKRYIIKVTKKRNPLDGSITEEVTEF